MRLVCVPENQFLLTIFFIIKGIYGFLSIIIYLLNVTVMYKGRNKFNKTFRWLYTTAALLSSLFFTEYFTVKQFITLGYYCDSILESFARPTWILMPTRLIASYCSIAILVLYFLISLHRLTAVLFPVRGVKLWDDHLQIILATSLFSPLLFMWFVPFCRGFVIQSSLGGLDIDYEDLPFNLGITLSTTFFSVIAAILFGSLSLFNTVFMLTALKTKVVSVNDYGLIYFEIFMAFVTLLYASTQACLYFAYYVQQDELMTYVVEYVRTYVVDIFILPQAWTLLLFCKPIRSGVRQMFQTKPGFITQYSTS